ncbi:protein of unknown function [Pseudomonas sp. JV241A]|nr:protein of unknown function [Pseudomonas sp. JV241A]
MSAIPEFLQHLSAARGVGEVGAGGTARNAQRFAERPQECKDLWQSVTITKFWELSAAPVKRT